jgi:hypothetical protein
MNQLAADILYRHAEERLQAKNDENCPPRSGDEIQGLAHILEVHQIELEMQSNELLMARDEADRALELILKNGKAEALARRMVGEAEVLALQLVEVALAFPMSTLRYF